MGSAPPCARAASPTAQTVRNPVTANVLLARSASITRAAGPPEDLEDRMASSLGRASRRDPWPTEASAIHRPRVVRFARSPRRALRLGLIHSLRLRGTRAAPTHPPTKIRDRKDAIPPFHCEANDAPTGRFCS